ncbi:hypothetical protein BJD73_gp49 [Mycobacterium phage Brocalys]|uniref:Uncharacterized protein n=4 Tax=Cheoctovirus TaxID=1623281 RepID=G1DUP7_9CAUD|nr:hypothetical protein AU088_gp055 [Mycobacterium phage Cabrinians]YP_009303888.1 hypothetical protein BJD73_gp49 [Mycobacterium phage Brocalys]YP_009608128.1 hypothetical protein FDI15_gp053 [Mycobacterium phage ShiLan]YP_009955164.1 hypothetical protein I5H19_gp052 [Mycobacterium phage Burwell21]YP_009959220.1 hypothetical protein I5H58_gp060 [Mycobacterium phage Lizziana]YP_009961672.1 hypothetical protein I5H82_gp054 [Mycobacterium phage Priscilla]ASJ79650.1 hypothetical protein SEA_PIPP
MNLVERLNARFNNVIHDGLALVGAVVDPWLARLKRQAMSNALGRDVGLDYADSLVAAEAEEEVHEPSAGHRVSADPSSTPVGDIGPGAGMVPPPPAPGPSNGWDELHKQVGPNSPKWIHDAIDSTKQYCLSFAREFLDDDEFMELGEFLDTATAEELAAIRQHTEVSRADLTAHIRAIFLDGEEGEIGPLVLDLVDGIATQVTDSLVSAFRITPR